jgi:uncharacterized membrane protein YfcA
MSEPIKNRYEFTILFDVENGNPNGDPDAGNMPRVDPETGYGLVTDVCLKRKIRNCIETICEDKPGYRIYVKEGVPLQRSDKEALSYVGIDEKTDIKKMKKDDPELDRKICNFMCQNFFDIRTFGAVMSAWQFWRAGKVDMSLLKRILPGTFVGAVLGCLVMLYLPSEWLQPIIIVALMAAAAFVFSQRQLGAVSTYSGNTRGNVLAALTMALAIGFYDGFIGPGTGTFLIVGFTALGFDFVTAAGNAKVLNLMSNVTSFVLLIWWGQILYVYGIAMALCIFTGAFFGSRLAIRRGTGFVRLVMLAVTIVLIGKLGLSYFGIM